MLLVATLLLMLAGLAGMWLSILPSHLLSKAAQNLSDTSGLMLEAERPRLRFHNGLTLELESVGLTSRDNDALSATSRSASLSVGWSSLFGRSPQVSRVDLDTPVITLDVSEVWHWGGMVQHLALRDGTLRLKDEKLKATVNLADINGSWMQGEDGIARLQLGYLQDKNLMRLSAEFESAERLFNSGSPSDITLTGKGVTAAFSGRSGFAAGLQLDGQLNVETASSTRLAQLFGISTSANSTTLPMSFSSAFSLSGLAATLNGLQGKIASTAFSGQLGLLPGADRIVVSGSLKADSIFIWERQSPLANPWSETPILLFDALAIDSDVTLTTEKLVLREQDMGAANLSLATKDGSGTLTLSSERFAGGSFSAALDLTREGLQAKVSARAVEAQSALAGLLGLDWISGPLDVSLDFTGKGNSIASLIGSAAGKATMSSPSLTLKGLDLGALKRPDAALEWSTEQTTQGLKILLEGDLRDGIIVLKDSDLAGQGIVAKPIGEIDVLRQHFALGFAPKAKGVAEGLTLLGHWSKPVAGTSAIPELRQSNDTGKPAKAEAPPAN